MIYLKGQLVENIAGLSTRFQTILSMINGGPDWIRWAIGDSIMPACKVNNENELLLLIQQGLHFDNILRFNAFRLCLEKVLSMPDGDVEQLALVRNTGFDTESHLHPLLTRNKLMSYSDIQTAADFIQNHQPDNNKLFEWQTYSDTLLLAAFVKQLPVIDEQVMKQAFHFAEDNATTVSEFIDLFNFFIYAVDHVFPVGLSPLIQTNEVAQLYNQLLPISYNLLFTPSIDPGNSEALIRENLQQIISSGRCIGYATCAAAATNLVQNIKLSGQDDASIKTQAESYLTTILNQLCLTAAPEGLFSQDGQLITYAYEASDVLAVIGVSSTGNISILPETKLKQTT
jgi:hypothetical protein